MAQKTQPRQARGKKRDCYRAQLYAFDNSVGVHPACYDLSAAISLLEHWARERGFLEEQAAITMNRDGEPEEMRSVADLLRVALEAFADSINPAIWVYDQLQRNLAEAETLATWATVEGETEKETPWVEAYGALARTLERKPIAERGVFTTARRNLAYRAKTDPTLAAYRTRKGHRNERAR